MVSDNNCTPDGEFWGVYFDGELIGCTRAKDEATARAAARLMVLDMGHNYNPLRVDVVPPLKRKQGLSKMEWAILGLTAIIVAVVYVT